MWGDVWKEAEQLVDRFRPRLRIELLSAALGSGARGEVIKDRPRATLAEADSAGRSALHAHFQCPPLRLAASWLAEVAYHEHSAPLSIHVACNVADRWVPLGTARIDLRDVPGCPQPILDGAAEAESVGGGGGVPMMGHTEAGLEECFQQLDTDGNGSISRAEMASAIAKFTGRSAELRQVDEMMRAADTDGDGEVSLAEFKVAMRAAPPAPTVAAAPTPEEVPLMWCGVLCGTLRVKLAFQGADDLPRKQQPAVHSASWTSNLWRLLRLSWSASRSGSTDSTIAAAAVTPPPDQQSAV
jgi:hypothetical protein